MIYVVHCPVVGTIGIMGNPIVPSLFIWLVWGSLMLFGIIYIMH